MSCTTVSYTIKSECQYEHTRLIEAIFTELQSTEPVNIDYRVIRSADELTYTHSSTSNGLDGKNPITDLASFIAFTENLSERVIKPPVVDNSELIGNYRSDQPAIH